MEGPTPSLSPLRHASEAACERLMAWALKLSDGSAAVEHSAEITPEWITERYRILELLGRGAFANVYLADDTKLGRRVAVKLLRRAARESARPLSEARATAALRNEGIVQVHDVGETADQRAFIVFEHIDGRSLAAVLSERSLPLRQSVEIILAVTRALGAAHTAGIVHRDLKPGNILIDGRGVPRIADFGMALQIDDGSAEGEIAGTPGYMAPEQMRGETHRVDARTDLWAVGVILFEMLTGQRAETYLCQRAPLRHWDQQKVLALHQATGMVPVPLAAILARCLAAAQADRYQTTSELAEDLDAWLHAEQSLQSPHSHLAVIPKGLRRFDETDSEFFLGLLPGPFDRHGLPESIRFWKRRIEARNTTDSLTVGVCYGSSGCGKSSLIRAGVVPRLATHVAVAWIDSTPFETETALLERLRRIHIDLAPGLELSEVVASIRTRNARHPQAKTLIILDQFEQWLAVQQRMESCPLIDALRQCDGHVSCLLIVRDDFWLPLTRFMQMLEVPLNQGHNTALVDLFELEHAAHVLRMLGQASGKLGDQSSASEEEFLNAALKDIALAQRVACVQIVFLAEALRSADWSIETLHRLGGARGLMEQHLEQLLVNGTRQPPEGTHSVEIRPILRALLPDQASDIKGPPRSIDELTACTTASSSEDVGQILMWMDRDLRLITRQESRFDSCDKPAASIVSYQLAHDFLVPLVWRWLDRKRRETMRGRAEILLGERTRWWFEQPAPRQLPGVLDWLRIRLWTRRRYRSDAESRLVAVADRHHLQRMLLALTIIVLLSWITLEEMKSIRVRSTALRLMDADIAEVPAILADSGISSSRLSAHIAPLLNQHELTLAKEFRIRLGLVAHDPSQIPHLFKLSTTFSPSEVTTLATILKRCSTTNQIAAETEMLWSNVESPARLPAERLRSLALLADLCPADARWKRQAAHWTQWMIAEPPHLISDWIKQFDPIGNQVFDEWLQVIRKSPPGHARRVALEAVLRYFSRDTGIIISVIPWLNTQELPVAVNVLEHNKPLALARLEVEIRRRQESYARMEKPKDLRGEAERDQRSEQTALLILTRTLLGDTRTLLANLEHQPDPRVRTALIHNIIPVGMQRKSIWTHLAAARNPGTRSALLIALGSPDADRNVPPETTSQIELLTRLFKDDPDSGVHSATEWLLNTLGETALVERLKRELAANAPQGERKWFIVPNGLTFAVVEPGTFDMGPPPWDGLGIARRDIPHPHQIPRRFAISTTCVTRLQFQQLVQKPQIVKAHTDSLPMTEITPSDAMKYCLTLSHQIYGGADHDCYLLGTESSQGLTIPKPDCVQIHGFRLPTEGEMEYAVRAGTVTPRHFGYAPHYLPAYAWFFENTKPTLGPRPVGRLRPNPWGLFDSHGNVLGLCQDSAHRQDAGGMATTDDLLWNSPEVHREGQRRAIAKGTYYVQPEDVINSSYWLPALTPCDFFGFRVAQTLSP